MLKRIILNILRTTYKIFIPKFTIGTSCILVNKNNEVYLQKHRFWPNYSWGFPGGYIKSNETPQIGVIREVKEESGLIIKIIRQISIKKESKTHFTIYFLGEIISDRNFKLQRVEILDAGFFNINNLPSPLLKDHKEIIKKIISPSS